MFATYAQRYGTLMVYHPLEKMWLSQLLEILFDFNPQSWWM
jgi:hypothetical protein